MTELTGTGQTAPVASPGLSVKDVVFSYPGRRRRPPWRALQGVNLEAQAGQSVAILGPNGSGKSTLIRIICGLLQPDSGQVLVFGAGAGRRRGALSVVFQFPALDRHLTVWENLRDQAAMYGIPRHEARSRIDGELRRAGLAERRHDLVKTLSGGLTRRADLARALLHDPKLLLLDEPTAGLDLVARRNFMDHLFERRDEKSPIVILSTHQVEEADRCDRVIMLHQGRVVADGHPAALRQEYGSEPAVMIRTTDPPSIAGLTWSRSIVGFFTATTDDPEVVRRAAERLAGSGTGFSITQSMAPTLAEVFERLTGERLDEPPGQQQQRQEEPT